MSATKPSNEDGRYHHGNLRSELLRIARDEIARNGANGVTLSSIARLAGVSQPAPYRHFVDREALLSGVAEIGFEEFNQALAEAAAKLAPRAALRAISLAYVQFGELNIELYRLMFASRFVPEARLDSDLANAADKAFNHLRRTMRKIFPSETVERRALLTWAQLHGLVMLRADGFVPGSLSQLIDTAN